MRATPVLADVGNGLRRNPTMTLSLVVTVAISMFLVGLGLWTQTQVDRSQAFYYGKAEVAVFFCNAAQAADPRESACRAGPVSAADRSRVRAALAATGAVRSVSTETQEQAFANLRAEYPDSAVSAQVRPDQLQESLRVHLADPAGYAAVVAAVDGRPGVQQVADLRGVLDPLFGTLRTLRVGSLALAALLLGVAVLLIANTVRLAAYARRRETAVMRLVGASRFAVRAPFVLQSVLAGVAGAVLAGGGLAVWQQQVVTDRLRAHIPVTPWVGWSEVAWVFPVLVGIAVVVCAVPATLSLRRYLRV